MNPNRDIIIYDFCVIVIFSLLALTALFAVTVHKAWQHILTAAACTLMIWTAAAELRCLTRKKTKKIKKPNAPKAPKYPCTAR
jgi:hypothetical protein